MSRKPNQYVLGYNLAVKFFVMLTCPLVGGMFGGGMLDKRLGTAPWLMFILTIIALAFSIYAIYRVSTRELGIGKKKETD